MSTVLNLGQADPFSAWRKKYGTGLAPLERETVFLRIFNTKIIFFLSKNYFIEL
jgi:hypothetical protein